MSKFNLEQVLNNIDDFVKHDFPDAKDIKIMDFDNKLIIGCIPVAITAVQPDDQSPCIIENCKSCDNEMWVSEKKRNRRRENSNVEIYCFFCIVVSMNEQGLQIPIFDIGSVN